MHRTRTNVLVLSLVVTPMIGCDPGSAPPADKAEAAAGSKKAADAPDVAAEPSASETIDVAAGATVDIRVDATGYHPELIRAPANSKITRAVLRATKSGCGQELVIEAMKLSKELPLGETVKIEVEVPATGELKFACGMDMYRGKVVAAP